MTRGPKDEEQQVGALATANMNANCEWRRNNSGQVTFQGKRAAFISHLATNWA